MVLGRLVYYFLPEKKLYIKATSFSACFVWLDITSFIVQLGGGLMLSGTGQSAKVLTMGKNIYMGGIGMQQFFILIFLGIAIMFHRRVLILERAGVLATTGKTKWRMILYCLYASLLLISVRPLRQFALPTKLIFSIRPASSTASSSSRAVPAATTPSHSTNFTCTSSTRCP